VAPDPPQPDRDDPACLGQLDPDAQDDADQRELIRFAMSRGATPEQLAQAPNLGELALDLTLRPRGALPLREVAASAGIDWPTTLRLMTAAGLPTDPDFHVTADEAASIRLLAGAHNDLLGDEATLQLARVTGNAMARLAETLVGVFRLQVELPRRAAGRPYVDVVKEYSELTETLLPSFVATLDASLRRQIVAVAERMWSTDPERSVVTVQRTVGFVDLVGDGDGDGVAVAARAHTRPGRVRPADLRDCRRGWRADRQDHRRRSDVRHRGCRSRVPDCARTD
jgi:hypothetical protein